MNKYFSDTHLIRKGSPGGPPRAYYIALTIISFLKKLLDIWVILC